MENFKWQLVFNFSFWYFPSLIPIKWIDLILSRRWVISYVDQLKLDANGKEVLVIAEAGPSSIIVNELLSKYKNIKIHYRINDNINSFRIPSAYEVECHTKIMSISDSRIIRSAPAPMANQNVFHIPPGVDFIGRGATLQKTILYWGVYPISKNHLSSLLHSYPDYQIQYTGPVDLKLEGAEFLGFLSPRELSSRISTVALGVMIFPDNRFDWWLWSNKMTLMRSLKLPIIGMMQGSGDNILDLYPDQCGSFHGIWTCKV